MQSAYDIVADEFGALNNLILEQLNSDVALVEDISQYLVNSGGKRIRPLITLLAAGAVGDSNRPKQILLATAIEFLHTATLLHDDVVDMSMMRRGKPTANANWGNAPSVLVGDFVYSRAFQLLVEIGSLPVMQILSKTTSNIAEGEVKQLTLIGNLALSEQDYFDVISKKTAQLFAGACESVALISQSDSATQGHLRDFGLALGLAFQLIDDYLDYAGNSDDLGKNVGDDLAEGKLTLPLIEALRITDEQKSADHAVLTEIIQKKDLSAIAKVIEITQSSGALERTLDSAKQQTAKAIYAANLLPPSPYRDEMVNISNSILSRSV